MKNTTTAKSNQSLRTNIVFAIVLLAMLLPGMALANEALPFEGNLKALTDSLTGPVAFGISIVGIVAAGELLIFGGEISGFLRTIVFLVLVISIIVNAATIVNGLGGKDTGAGAMVVPDGSATPASTGYAHIA